MLINGARQVGKSTLAQQMKNNGSAIFIALLLLVPFGQAVAGKVKINMVTQMGLHVDENPHISLVARNIETKEAIELEFPCSGRQPYSKKIKGMSFDKKWKFVMKSSRGEVPADRIFNVIGENNIFAVLKVKNLKQTSDKEWKLSCSLNLY